MLQVLAILALTLGGAMCAIGAFWYFRLVTWDDANPLRALGSLVSILLDFEKWELYWRPVALQVIGGLIFAWGWFSVTIPA